MKSALKPVASKLAAKSGPKSVNLAAGYGDIRSAIVSLVNSARQAAARNVNSLMTASYWEIGRHIVEAEQKGKRRAGYGEQLIERLSSDLMLQFGRGFSADNLENMRRFYGAYPVERISETLSRISTGNGPLEISETAPRKFRLHDLAEVFPLPWSSYMRLVALKDNYAREFYETEALRGGWSVRQLDRQIGSQFYERTALSKNKAAMLTKGAIAKPEDIITPDEAVKDPYVLEFLNLKDEYSESELEEALIHRRLRCLVIIDLKLSSLTHADAGQMHMYCNYAKEHWTLEGENPPVGLILCADKGHALARYALDGLPNKIMAANYKTVLPDAEMLQKELEKTRVLLESGAALKGQGKL